MNNSATNNETTQNAMILKTNLSFVSDNGVHCPFEHAKQALGKFFMVGSLLSKGQYIGFDLSADSTHYTRTAFADAASRISDADFSWIFDGCGNRGEAEQSELADLFADGRTVYLLCPNEQFDEERQHNVVENSQKVAKLMKETGAVMRLLLYPDAETGSVKALLFLSCPDSMPLHMSAVLCSVFYDCTPVPVTSMDMEPCSDINGIFFGFKCMLYAFISCEKEQKVWRQSDEEADDAERQTGERTPIEVLDLSVRSFACLKRAGIDTVEQVRTMTEEDFRQVRNLGRRSYEEIMQKLSAYDGKSKTEDEENSEDVDYAAMLAELVGLKNAKEQVQKIIAFARMKKAMADEGKDIAIALNMCFLGNPGTAKTTVARILAGIFYREGLLKSPKVVEVGRADLVGEYVGHTAPKVQEAFERAKGKILFIDEAYALLEEKGFGDEAINTIIQEMENHRHETIVIFAGYPQPMQKLLSRNPGMRSRVPFTVTFDDYSVEEMVEIAVLQAKHLGFEIHPDAQKKIADICNRAPKGKEFGNGRFCRNLVESAVLAYAMRVFGDGSEAESGDFVLLAEDFTETADGGKQDGSPIGFQC